MTEWSHGDVTVNGVRLHYVRTGGNKPAVVLAHGLTDNGLCWSPVAQALEQDYAVVLYDARGHGLSEAPATGYTYENLAGDLAGLVQALGLRNPVLGGHSMGAATVAAAAATYPTLASRIVLCDPPWRAEPQSPKPEEQHKMAEQWRDGILASKSKTRAELIAQCRQRSPTWSEAELGPWADAKLQVNPAVVQIIMTPQQPWREVVSAITCPILLITADPDKGAIVTPELAQEAASLWHQGRVVRIPGAGHSIRRYQFELYMQAWREFLK